MKKEIFPCPECGHQDWDDRDYPCEDCGDHSGVICNGCGQQWDHVWGNEVYDKVLDSYDVDSSWDIADAKKGETMK